MDHPLLALQFARAAQQSGAECGLAEALEDGRPDDQVGDPGLVLDGDEDDAVGAAGGCRISTIPAIDSRRLTGRCARSAAVTRPSRARSARRKASGWRFKVRLRLA